MCFWQSVGSIPDGLRVTFWMFGPLGFFVGVMFSPWTHFKRTLATFPVLRNGLGHPECAKGCPMGVSAKYHHSLANLFGVAFLRFFEFSKKKKVSGIGVLLDVILSCLGRSTTGTHMQSVRACANETNFSVFWGSLETDPNRVTFGLHFGNHFR